MAYNKYVVCTDCEIARDYMGSEDFCANCGSEKLVTKIGKRIVEVRTTGGFFTRRRFLDSWIEFKDNTKSKIHTYESLPYMD